MDQTPESLQEFSSLDRSTSVKATTADAQSDKMEGGEQNSEILKPSADKQLPSSDIMEEDKSKTAPDDSPAVPPEDTQVVHDKKPATSKENTEKQCVSAPSDQTESQNKTPTSNETQTSKKAQVKAPTQVSPVEHKPTPAPQAHSDKTTQAGNQNDKPITRKPSKNKHESVTNNQPKYDQNANEEPNDKHSGQNKQQRKSKEKENKQEPNQTETGKAKEKMVFGPQALTEVVKLYCNVIFI